MLTRRFEEKQSEELAKLLLQEEVVGFPTETVYGLGVLFDSRKAYERLMEVKDRPEQKPFTLMCGSFETIKEYAFVDDRIERLLHHFMPGPLTVLLKGKPDVPAWVTMGLKTIGVRISSHPVVSDIINKAGKPLLVPSANKSGEPPLKDWREVAKIFDKEIAGLVMLDADGDLPSTIVDLSADIRLIREGSIPMTEIRKIWEETL